MCQIDLDGGENTGDEAGENDCARNSPAWIVRLIAQGRDPVKANVGEYGDGGSAIDSGSRWVRADADTVRTIGNASR